MKRFTTYELQDHIAVELARIYAEQFKTTFFVAVGKFSNYDITSQNRDIVIEVKCEGTPSRTGNVCLEYWNTDLDAPSGVLQTKATIWLHLILDDIGYITAYEYEINRLRKLVIEKGLIKHNQNAQFKLIPLDVFKKHARRSFPLNSKFETELKLLTGRYE